MNGRARNVDRHCCCEGDEKEGQVVMCRKPKKQNETKDDR